MRDTILAAFAILVLFWFLGILVYEVPRPDLIIVVLVTVFFAVWDMLRRRN